MRLYPGMWFRKLKSDRVAQVAALDGRYAYLTWDHDGKQTRVLRERLSWGSVWSHERDDD